MELVERLRSIEGVKNVKTQSSKVLKIQLFSKNIPGSEAQEIQGNLRKISQNLSSKLDNAVENGEINGWNWIEKPQKQYRDRSPNSVQVSDREGAGHKPNHYTVNIEGIQGRSTV